MWYRKKHSQPQHPSSQDVLQLPRGACPGPLPPKLVSSLRPSLCLSSPLFFSYFWFFSLPLVAVAPKTFSFFSLFMQNGQAILLLLGSLSPCRLYMFSPLLPKAFYNIFQRTVWRPAVKTKDTNSGQSGFLSAAFYCVILGKWCHFSQPHILIFNIGNLKLKVPTKAYRTLHNLKPTYPSA